MWFFSVLPFVSHPLAFTWRTTRWFPDRGCNFHSIYISDTVYHVILSIRSFYFSFSMCVIAVVVGGFFFSLPFLLLSLFIEMCWCVFGGCSKYRILYELYWIVLEKKRKRRICVCSISMPKICILLFTYYCVIRTIPNETNEWTSERTKRKTIVAWTVLLCVYIVIPNVYMREKKKITHTQRPNVAY